MVREELPRADDSSPNFSSGKEWMRVTLASIGDAVITTDFEGRVSFLNGTAEQLTGWHIRDALGESLNTVFRIVNEETRRAVENPATRALKEGVIVGLANHTLLIAKDGRERPIDDSAAPIRDETGLVAGVVLVFRDVTARREAERTLRDSEERFRLLIESVQDYAIFPLDTEGHIVGWNLGAERIKGYLARDILGKHFSIFYSAADIAARKPQRELLAAATDGRFEDENWRLRQDGTMFWANVVITALRDAQGNLRGFSKVTRDLTGRKQAEDAVRSSEQRLRSITRSAKDAIISGDGRGVIIAWNQAAAELFGYTEQEALNRPLTLLMPERYRSQHEAGLQRFRRTAEARVVGKTVELHGRRKDASEFPMELSLSVAETDQGPIFTGIIRDLTERRKAENDRLEAERATARAEALADLNRRKDEFLAMLSHELRNPLSAMVNAFHVLRHEDQSGGVDEQARLIIERQLSHLTAMVDDLLEVSRVTSGQVRLEKQRADLRAVLNGSIESVRPRIEKRKHLLSLSMPDQPVWVHVDIGRLDQAFVNLLTNAIKFTDPGGRIDVTLRVEVERAVVSFRDTGAGISADLLPRIFDLFTQGPTQSGRAQGGLGVGLTVVKRIVDLHDGTVEVFSPGAGRGSEFIVRLPIAGPREPAAQPAPAMADRPPRKPLDVLVVDDNEDAANSMSALLRIAGHSVRTVFSAAAALTVARESIPNVVIMDIAMPEMDGYEAARRFRADPTLGRVTLIAISGFGQESDLNRSNAAGFDAHLLKPVDPQRLEQELARHCQGA